MRPIRPDDKSALSRAFEHLSEESRYRRFLAPIKRLTGSDLAYLTELDHHGHGIGTQMLPRLARRAREAGIDTFVGICLASNSSMIQVLRELDPAARLVAQDPGLVEVDVELPTAAPRRHIDDTLRLYLRSGPGVSRVDGADESPMPR